MYIVASLHKNRNSVVTVKNRPVRSNLERVALARQ